MRVEYDFPMLELRSYEIVDGRHVTFCAWSVAYINLPPIVRDVSSVTIRALKASDLPFMTEKDSLQAFAYDGTFELFRGNEIAGRVVCAQVLGVSTIAGRYERIAIDARPVLDDPDTRELFNWKAGWEAEYGTNEGL